MKILVCLNADVVSNVALNLLLPALAPHEVRVALSTRIGGVSVAEPSPRQELRVAEQTFASEVLFPLIEAAARPDDGRYLTFREIERHRGIPTFPLPAPNSASGLALLREFRPDLIVSIRYGAIFKNDAIAVAPLGILNLHAGLLPAYRGVIASFRALMADEREIGCTLHYITDGTIDTGPIVGQARVPVHRERSLFWHVLSLYPSAIVLVAEAIERLARGEALSTHAQSGGTYFSYPRADEWEEFHTRGWRVADPSDLLDLVARYVPRATGLSQSD